MINLIFKYLKFIIYDVSLYTTKRLFSLVSRHKWHKGLPILRGNSIEYLGLPRMHSIERRLVEIAIRFRALKIVLR